MRFLSVISAAILASMFFASISIGSEDPELVLYMNFEQEQNNVVRDISGYENNGNIFDSVKWTDNGKNGKALEFTGGCLEIPSSDTLQADDGGFTIEAWVKADPSSDSWARFVDKYYDTGYCIGRHEGDLVVGVEFNGSPNTFMGTTAVFDNKWHHVAMTREVSGGSNVLNIYVDGELENTSGGGEVVQHNMDTTPVRLGAADNCCEEGPPDDRAAFYKGLMDEVAIYKRTLTQAEIKKDMEEGISAAVEPDIKLATSWAMIKKEEKR